jgi:malonyl-CoA O-methyltransferase
MTFTTLDKQSIRRSFNRAALSYDNAAVLQRRVADELIQRLAVVRKVPQTVLDAGCGTGYLTARLARRYRRAHVIGLDLSTGMAQRARRRRLSVWSRLGLSAGRTSFVAADAESLPVPERAVDFVVSNLTVQWCDPQQVFAEFLRVLKPGGLLMFSTFGPDTLRELRSAWREADAGVHVHDFIDMHDLGDMLVRAGFADPVMDVERLTLTYPGVRNVLLDLKHIGAHNAAPDRARGLMPKGRYTRFLRAYEQYRRDGAVPATYEVVYGHAWAPEKIRRPDVLPATIPLASIRRNR